MPVVIGVDEAGYGPNLGPLVVAATVWEVDDGIDGSMFYKLLRKVVTNTVEKTSNRVVWADSKAVYKNGNGFDRLERGVFSALATFDCRPRSWGELWQFLDWRLRSGTPWCELPWHVEYSCTLPFCCPEDELAELSNRITECLAAAGIRLLDVLARPVFPEEFNRLVAAGNKSDTLSLVTLELVAEALQSAPGGAATIYCDKHGGRNFYHAHLQTRFADAWIEVRVESDTKSVYRFQSGERPVEFGFWMSGEQFLPVALASMTAKYLRETAMRPFNEFWCSRVPGLKPTAGYPNDAKRFKQEIAPVQRQLEIADHLLWRTK
jgi:ribonuclease HII